MKIVMVAAENGAIPGGKVGGIGDVIRDIPNALARLGHEVDVIVPGYQLFSARAGAIKVDQVCVRFRGQEFEVGVFRLELDAEPSVRCFVIDHPLLAPGRAGQIYCADAERPFATDASKFAFFCAAVCETLVKGVMGQADVLHLHDWHAALIAVLVRFEPRFSVLGLTRLVYTIHNLALQGIRPFNWDDSSLQAWFPGLRYDATVLADPRYGDCINPMRAAINLCERVHAVSPRYAQEIQHPSRPEQGFFGGEGLEHDLCEAASEGRLVGILNGCEYPEEGAAAEPLAFADLLVSARQQLLRWVGAEPQVSADHFIARERLADLTLSGVKPTTLVTSVGRLTDQKALLFRTTMADGRSCLDHLLGELQEGELFVLLGSGDPTLERFFTAAAGRWSNFLFLRGYADTLSDDLYRLGELFLMPSSFEPCGISQMLAMRAGQPCLVHGVGGLADTIIDQVDGFVFDGTNLVAQSQAFVRLFAEVMADKRAQSKRWKAVVDNASRKRFVWDDVAGDYLAKLYR